MVMVPLYKLLQENHLLISNETMHNTPNTTFIHCLQESQGEPDLLDLLNAEERQRAAAFIFEQHRHLYIAAHVFLRKVLSYHTSHPPEHWAFHSNKYGKPFISNPEFKSLQFNLSHTQGMIVCAVSQNNTIGVDVEGSRPLKYLKQMSQRNYTEKENEDIFSLTCPEAQLQRFYTYWTLKEALVKALGCGLSIPLKKLCFIQEKNNDWILDPTVELIHEAPINHWLFLNKKILTRHQVSIAVRSQGETDHRIMFIDSNNKNSRYWKEQSLST